MCSKFFCQFSFTKKRAAFYCNPLGSSYLFSTVQTIVPDIKITDICEDLSGMTDEMTFDQDSTSPPCDGKRSVSFVCNGHAYSIELNSYGDWFNTDMFDFMDHVLEKENCPFKLYEFPAQMQFVIMLYCSETQQEKIAPLIDEF